MQSPDIRRPDDLPRVFSDLVRVQIALWNGVDSDLRQEAGTSLANVESLRVIEARTRSDGAGRGGAPGSCRVNDIADDLIITVGGASKIVDRLEASGLVVRRANPDDRRSSLIELTAEGSSELRRVTSTFEAALVRRLGDRLDDATLDQLARALEILRAPIPNREDTP